MGPSLKPHIVAAALLGLSLSSAACSKFGLAPYADDRVAGTQGVAMKGMTYALDFADFAVTDPAPLGTIFDAADSPTLFVHILGQGRTAFEPVAAQSGPNGGQGSCQPIWELAEGRWKSATRFRIDGGMVDIDFAATAVAFTSVDIEATVSEDAIEWTGGIFRANVDTRELRGTALPAEDNPCDAIVAAGGSCYACSDTAPACTTIEISFTASEAEVDLNPNVDTSGC